MLGFSLTSRIILERYCEADHFSWNSGLVEYVAAAARALANCSLVKCPAQTAGELTLYRL